MGFFSLIFIIAIACSIITIKTLVGYNDMKFVYKLLISAFVLISWFAPVWINLLRKSTFAAPYLYSYLQGFGYFLFGMMFILFCLLVVRDVIWFTSYGFSKIFKNFHVIDPKDAAMLWKTNAAVVVLSLLLAFHALYEGVKIPRINEIDIHNPKITKETSVLLISDLHITRATSVEKIKKIVEMVNGLNADVIALSGDIIDDVDIQPQLDELAKLKSKHGVYAALGNHEVYRNKIFTMTMLYKAGFKTLVGNGEKIEGTDIFIMGIDDYGAMRRFSKEPPSLEKILKRTGGKDYKILLSHTPYFIDTLKNNEIDLQLSGHTHGGQIFPFHIGVKQANEGYLAGLYDVGEMKMFVSRGAGYWGPPMRLFAPSDITLIKLKP